LASLKTVSSYGVIGGDRKQMRTFAIWVGGLLASAIVGGFVIEQFDPDPEYHNLGNYAVIGALAGMLIFTCVRLWVTSYQSR